MNKTDFGKYAPNAFKSKIIECSNQLKTRNWLNRKLASLFLRLVGANRIGGIFDWQIFNTQCARLYPGDNLSEKRVLMTPHFWDPTERELLHLALRESSCDRPFVFVDAGANAGLYSLYMQSLAIAESKEIVIIAVEPAPGVLERLQFNIASSQADAIKVLPWAVTERREDVKLFLNTHNRGESSLLGEGENIVVEGHPLSEVFAATKSDVVDAMKIDIEGAELPAVRGMFDSVCSSQWPRWVVIEGCFEGRNSEAVDLFLHNGYQVEAVTRMNTVLKKRERN